MAKLTGVENVMRRLERLPEQTVTEVGMALVAAGSVVKAEAQRMITSGSRSGRDVRGVVRKKYTASAPGEPPAYDTMHLHSQIEVTQPATLIVEVSSNAKYSAALEFGSSKMLPRPFMGPAARAKKAEVRKIVRAAASRALKKG